METKHTNGEWIYKKYQPTDFGVYLSNTGMDIALVRGWTEEAEANAKLIAAAPKMISMLIAISETIGCGIPIHKGDSIYENMLKIIKKATE